MSLSQQVFTNAGIDMLGQANAGVLLTIEKIVVGNGSATGDSDIYPLTALIGYKADVTITRKQDQGSGKMLISGVLNEWELTGSPFQLKELGIMAHTGTLGGVTTGADTKAKVGGPVPPDPSPTPRVVGASQLYCASNVYSDPADTVTPGGLNQHAFDILIEIDRATDVEVIIGDASTVDIQNEPADATVGPGWYDKRVGNVFYIKRAVAGPGIGLDETSYPDRVIISVKTIVNDVDLYVPVNHHSKPPGGLGFPDIQTAHNYLLGFRIPSDKTARIHVDAGTFNVTPPAPGASAILFSHPDSKQIQLLGEPRNDRNVAAGGIQAVGGGVTKDVFLSNTSGLAVGQRIYIASAGSGWCGGCKINSIVTNSKINCSVERGDTQAQYTILGGANVGRVSFHPTVVVWTTAPSRAPASGEFLLNCPNGIGLIKDMTFDGGFYCLALEYGNIVDCAVICIAKPGGFRTRRSVTGGSGTVGLGGECVFTQTDFGLVGVGVMYAFDQTYINGCGQAISPSGSGFAIGSITGNMDNTIVYLIHNQYAINVANGAIFDGGSIIFESNDYGIACGGGTVLMNVAYPSVFARNGIDLLAQGMGYIQLNRWQQPLPSCSPPVSVLPLPPAPNQIYDGEGNQNSFIHLLNSSLPPRGAAVGGAPAPTPTRYEVVTRRPTVEGRSIYEAAEDVSGQDSQSRSAEPAE
jgi:hypothetical protein